MNWTLDNLNTMAHPLNRLGLSAADLQSAERREIGEVGKYESYLRYYHTLRYLRPVQVYGRAWHYLAPRPRLVEGPAPPSRRPVSRWEGSARREQTMLGPTTFRFLNRTFDIAASPGGWNLTDAPEKLWLLNLHYFDDLNASDASARLDWHYNLISDWIARNPPAEGIGWRDAYAVSLRIVNWIKWHLGGNMLPAEALRSLVTQVRHLEDNIETYLLGNHVLANAKALVFAGTFFKGPEADGWRTRGLRLLESELQEEILDDGGHYERSPMYHCIILEDLLDVFQLSQMFPAIIGGDLPQRLTAKTASMRFWLKAMSHPDGEISFFNDAALGIAPNSAAIEAYAKRLGLAPSPTPQDGLTYLEASGYARYQRGSLCALVDIGEIGPDHIPGHAHADTLSFELSLRGQRVLVNSGTSAYKIQPVRRRERGTAAHNTVTVDGRDSSEVWGAFRVARRARPRDLKFREVIDGLVIEAAHDGYLRLPGKILHHRTFHFAEHHVDITDRLTGDFERAEARYHFHPIALRANNGMMATARDISRPFRAISCSARIDKTEQVNSPVAYVEPYSFHPGFGVSELSRCLVLPIVPRPDRQPSLTGFSLSWEDERAVMRSKPTS